MNFLTQRSTQVCIWVPTCFWPHRDSGWWFIYLTMRRSPWGLETLKCRGFFFPPVNKSSASACYLDYRSDLKCIISEFLIVYLWNLLKLSFLLHLEYTEADSSLTLLCYYLMLVSFIFYTYKVHTLLIAPGLFSTIYCLLTVAFLVIIYFLFCFRFLKMKEHI